VTLPRARILKADTTTTLQPLLSPAARGATYETIARERLEARLAAARIESQARADAQAILAEARQRAAREPDAEAAQLVPLAVLLAERIVGEELALAPERILSIARGVIAEARAVRGVTLEAHPDDAQVLRDRLRGLRGSRRSGLLEGAIVAVRDNPSLARGALRLHTEGGTLDAQLSPRLERLAAAVRDALADTIP
jgi:flagellar assembly protein FliH